MTYEPAVPEGMNEVGEHEPVGEDVGERPLENWASRRYELEGPRGLISVGASIARHYGYIRVSKMRQRRGEAAERGRRICLASVQNRASPGPP